MNLSMNQWHFTPTSNRGHENVYFTVFEYCLLHFQQLYDLELERQAVATLHPFGRKTQLSGHKVHPVMRYEIYKQMRYGHSTCGLSTWQNRKHGVSFKTDSTLLFLRVACTAMTWLCRYQWDFLFLTFIHDIYLWRSSINKCQTGTQPPPTFLIIACTQWTLLVYVNIANSSLLLFNNNNITTNPSRVSAFWHISVTHFTAPLLYIFVTCISTTRAKLHNIIPILANVSLVEHLVVKGSAGSILYTTAAREVTVRMFTVFLE